MKNLSLYLSVLVILLSCKPSLDFKDSNLTPDQRAEALLQQMNVDEELAQIVAHWGKKSQFTDSEGRVILDSLQKYVGHGIGQIARPSEGPDGPNTFNRSPRSNAEYTNAIQKYLVEETRLGIPAIFHEEALHGHAARGGTSFPQPIGIASSWNPELVEQLFDMTAKEARARGTSLVLTPVVDVVRDPRWGRTEETYGEDPYLAGEIGLAAVRGFQGRGDQIDNEHVMCTLKHITGHGQPESGMNIGPANISERIIREVFLPPFKKCIMEGNAKAVMASYNEIDGVPSHANPWLIEDILRGEWGFDGVVVSDYYAIEELHRRHGVAASYADAAALALQTGIDIELPDAAAYPLLKEKFEDGSLSMNYLDTAVKRILKQKFQIGLFDNPYVDENTVESKVGNKENAALALKGAEESIILLENNGILPISATQYKTIAVIGPNANQVLLGGYSSIPPYHVTLLDGIKEKVGDQARILYAEGCGITEPGSWYADPVSRTNESLDRRKIQEAVSIARQADIVIMALGGNELTSREAWAESHMGDRTNLQLVGLQDELINKVAATGKPIVTVLYNGRPLAIQNVVEKSDAVFEAWYLGQENGRAMANVLFGDVNPSAKLPITFARSAGHLPVYYNYKPTARRGFLFDDVSPLYPFGYGLSYTTFDVSEPMLTKKSVGQDGSTSIKVTVKNTGNRAGAEVIQMYIRDDYSSVTRPVKELKGFKKVHLEAGDSAEVEIPITSEELAFFDKDMNWVVEPGSFKIMVGTSSDSDDLQSVKLEVN